MVLSDFLSRQIRDDSSPHAIIPIFFNIKEILKENYQNMVKDTYMVQTRSQAKAQANAPFAQNTTDKSGTQNAIPKVDKIPIKTEKEKDSKLPQRTVVNQQLPQGLVIPLGNIVPLSTHPSVRPPPKPPNTVEDAISSPKLGQNPNIDFQEKAPHEEGIITEMYVAPDQSYLVQLQELTKLVNTSKVVQKYLLQQADIDKILDIIKRKVLKGTHLPLIIKEIQAGYLTSPFFQGFV